jgi:hypothetical protein
MEAATAVRRLPIPFPITGTSSQFAITGSFSPCNRDVNTLAAAFTLGKQPEDRGMTGPHYTLLVRTNEQGGDSMRRLTPRRGLLAGAAVLALAVAGIAIAGTGTGGTTLVSATFTATTLSHSSTSTCTAANGDPITRTDATFTGTATSTDPHLNGPVTLHVRSVYDGKTNAGSLTGDVRIDGTSTTPPSGRLHASLQGVNVNGGVTGFLSGDSYWGTHFLGGFSSSFSTSGGFTNGAIGSGNPTSAAILVSGGCGHGDAQDQKHGDDNYQGNRH